MPCVYDDSSEEAKRQKKQKGALDLATRLLCELMSRVPAATLTSEMEEWKAEHKKMDEARKAREKLNAAIDRRDNERRLAELEKEAAALRKKLK